MIKSRLKIIIASLGVTLIPAFAWAGGFLFPSASTEAGLGGCQGGTCTTSPRPAFVPIPPPRPAHLGAAQAVRRSPVVLSFRTRGKSLGPACRRLFINGDGNLGPAGRKVASLIEQEPYRKHFLNSRALTPFCPKFSKLSEDQRTQAWVWFWMVLANEESTCNPSLRHATHFPDGRVMNPKPGYGLFAAELYPQHRSWRGRACQGNIRETSVQVSCAVHTMASTQLAAGRGVRWPASYWGPVRRASRQIIPNMRGFKSCF